MALRGPIRFLTKKRCGNRPFRCAVSARGAACPKVAAGYIREEQIASDNSTLGATAGWALFGATNRAGHGVQQLSLLGARCPAAPACGTLRGMLAAQVLGFMAAQPVTQVAAGYVNSGQHAIGGRFIPFRSLGLGKPYGQALLRRRARAFGWI